MGPIERELMAYAEDHRGLVASASIKAYTVFSEARWCWYVERNPSLDAVEFDPVHYPDHMSEALEAAAALGI